MRRPLVALVCVWLAIAACGAPSAAPTATAKPTTASATSASPTTASDGLQAVVIGDLSTYTYDTGLFSIDVPDNWTATDTSKTGEAIVVWTDPTQNALVGVDLFEESTAQTAEELTTFLQGFLDNTFGSTTDFTQDEPTPQNDGSVLIVWGYTAEASGGVTTHLLGNSFIEQREDKVSILTTLVPQDQFQDLLDSTNQIINSYSIDPSAALP